MICGGRSGWPAWLETAVKVYLANPQEVKNRKGHKTDDKRWLVAGAFAASRHDPPEFHSAAGDPAIARPDAAAQTHDW